MTRALEALAAGTIAVASMALTAGCGLFDRGMTADDAAATLDQYCSECHNEIDFEGNIDFARLDPAHVKADDATWEAVVRKLRTRTMPPQGARRPDADAYERLATTLESALDATAEIDPGRPALQRLNRAEYANAIRDLLDIEVDVTALLPPDDSAYGFDNNGDLLVVSPALLERYLSAADRVAALAVGDPRTVAGAQTYTVAGDQSQAQHLKGLPLGTVGGIAVEHNFPIDGE
jgi:hypothetical protein